MARPLLGWIAAGAAAAITSFPVTAQAQESDGCSLSIMPDFERGALSALMVSSIRMQLEQRFEAAGQRLSPESGETYFVFVRRDPNSGAYTPVKDDDIIRVDPPEMFHSLQDGSGPVDEDASFRVTVSRAGDGSISCSQTPYRLIEAERREGEVAEPEMRSAPETSPRTRGADLVDRPRSAIENRASDPMSWGAWPSDNGFGGAVGERSLPPMDNQIMSPGGGSSFQPGPPVPLMLQ